MGSTFDFPTDDPLPAVADDEAALCVDPCFAWVSGGAAAGGCERKSNPPADGAAEVALLPPPPLLVLFTKSNEDGAGSAWAGWARNENDEPPVVVSAGVALALLRNENELGASSATGATVRPLKSPPSKEERDSFGAGSVLTSKPWNSDPPPMPPEGAAAGLGALQ